MSIVTHFNIPSANATKATNATRFAMMFRIRLIPCPAPFEAASSTEESDLKLYVQSYISKA